ncbi:MAG: hypothetical protein ACYCOO_02405 [Chitinophagaceae bacterium]
MKTQNKKSNAEFLSIQEKLLLKIKRDYDMELDRKRNIEILIAKDLKSIIGNKRILVSNKAK